MSAAPAKSADPSMEEILASIRRIIADDDKPPEAAEAQPAAEETTGETARLKGSEPQEAASDEEDDVLDLTGADLAERAEADLDIDVPDLSFQASAGADEAKAREPASEPVVAPNPVMASVPPRPAEPERPRLAAVPPPPVEERSATEPRTNVRPLADALVSHATTASVGQAFNLLSHTIMSQNAHTLEDVVREMLRPMLKTWLDDNLPPLVERLVAAEIQRVARGQR